MQKRTLRLCSLTFLLISTASALVNYDDSKVWQNGTAQADIFREIAVDESNNFFYVVGTTSGDFASTSNGGTDVIVAKFSVDNTPVWIIQFGTPANDEGFGVTVGKNGDEIYVSGSTAGTISTLGETHNGTTQLTTDAYLAKLYASNGSMIWAAQWGSQINDSAQSIAYWAEDDTVIVAGYTESTTTVQTFVGYYLSNGTLLKINSTLSEPFLSVAISDIAVDSNKNIYLCGAVNDAYLYAAKILSSLKADWTVAALSATGSLISLDIDKDGNLWAVGTTNTYWTPEGELLTGITSPYYGGIAFRVGVNGVPNIAIGLNGTSDSGAYGLAIDDNNNLYVAGFATGEFMGISNQGQATQLFVARYSTENSELEYLTLDGSSGDDIPYAIGITNKKFNGQPAWLVAGATNGSYGGPAKGNLDAFTLKGTPLKENTKSGLSDASKIAIGVLVPLAVLSVGGVGAYFIIRNRRYHRNRQWEKSASTGTDLKDLHLSSIATTQNNFTIDFDEIELGNEIGQGAFGTVYRGKWRNSPAAVKYFEVDRLQGKALQDFIKEASNVGKLRPHRNVCQVYGVCTNPLKPLCIVMEFVPDNLQDLIYNKKIPVTVESVISLAKQISSGMSHIHQENILHCDLACRNLLVQSKGNNKYVVKIADFGLARVVESDQYNATSQSSFPVRWSAPEVLTQHKISKASDVWSFGVVIWEIAEGVLPYYQLPTNNEVIKHVCEQNHRLGRPTKIELPEELLKVMTDCWATDPTERPSFENIHKRLSDLKNLLIPSNRGSSLLMAPPNRSSKEMYNNMVPSTVNYNNVTADTSKRSDNYNNLDP